MQHVMTLQTLCQHHPSGISVRRDMLKSFQIKNETDRRVLQLLNAMHVFSRNAISVGWETEGENGQD
jgi:hypothetical protein